MAAPFIFHLPSLRVLTAIGSESGLSTFPLNGCTIYPFILHLPSLSVLTAIGSESGPSTFQMNGCTIHISLTIIDGPYSNWFRIWSLYIPIGMAAPFIFHLPSLRVLTAIGSESGSSTFPLNGYTIHIPLTITEGPDSNWFRIWFLYIPIEWLHHSYSTYHH